MLKHGLKFGVTTHLSSSYSWMNVANQADKKGDKVGEPYDGAQGNTKVYTLKNIRCSSKSALECE